MEEKGNEITRDKSSVDFGDLAESAEFQEFFTIMRNLTGLLMALVDPSGTKCKRLFPDESENPLCLAIKSCAGGRECCRRTDLANYRRAASGKTAISYLCHAGMVDIAVPIYVNGIHIATINCGQVLPERPTPERFDRFMVRNARLEMKANFLRDAYMASPFVETDRLAIIVRLCSFFADYFCEVGRRLALVDRTGSVEVDKARRYMGSHFRDTLSLEDVASHVGLSPAYFSNLFKRVTDENFTSFLQGLRISEAKRALAETDSRIADIAYEVGFANQTHFNRVFSKVVGCTPSEYRKRNRR